MEPTQFRVSNFAIKILKNEVGGRRDGGGDGDGSVYSNIIHRELEFC